MKACLSRQPVPASSKDFPELVDHRYFFDEFNEDKRVNVANYTCGLARNAVAMELHANKELRALPRARKGPALRVLVPP